MPVRKVKGGWAWGNNKPTTKEKARRQERAAYANGYRPKKKR